MVNNLENKRLSKLAHWEHRTMQLLRRESTGSSVIRTSWVPHLTSAIPRTAVRTDREWQSLEPYKDCFGGCPCELSGF